ncbi:MAG: C1 family peptidase [Rhizobiaceae bacterium]|nr:C1 family peptidase [Rhizobiaceae bacterium]MCV0404798.1 C1 family peptidase [Rhizobiaceae bacterium]
MASTKKPKRVLNALPDTVDFRDRLYAPSLIRVPPVSHPDAWRGHGIPVLDQGSEGACTGFALATVANYLLRVRDAAPEADEVSAWMLYAMAKRYDEWPGEDYDGSSARGAMKGWHKHGLCALRLWRNVDPDPTLEEQLAADAINRPLGAYFRVNHKDLVAMHAAISEVGVLYATALVHEGWNAVRSGDEQIEYRPGAIGGHAFAIVGYDADGLWIQNSWGEDWGAGGLARISYDDWLANGTDVWVAALGAPVMLDRSTATAQMRSAAPRTYESHVFADLRPHVITARNDGVLDDKGVYGLTQQALKDLVTVQMPARMNGWSRKRVMVYAHGGLVSQDSAIQTVANNRETLLGEGIYPLHFVWRSDFFSTLGNILRDAIASRRDENVFDAAKDFLLDRIDDTIEPLARLLGGKALWDEMKENATRSTTLLGGAARLTADHLAQARASGAIDEIHLVGHSAGAVFLAPFAKRLVDSGARIASLSLLAPACTLDLFEEVYRPLIEGRGIGAFNLFTLDDAAERDDDCANIYNKSLLYLVSHALERDARIAGLFGRRGTPLLGLQKDAASIPAAFWRAKSRTWHVAPGNASRAVRHGEFDDDRQTWTTVRRAIAGAARSAMTMPAVGAVPGRRARRQLRETLQMAMQRPAG